MLIHNRSHCPSCQCASAKKVKNKLATVLNQAGPDLTVSIDDQGMTMILPPTPRHEKKKRKKVGYSSRVTL